MNKQVIAERLFSPWRSQWDLSPESADRLATLDTLWSRRASGNHAMPPAPTERDVASTTPLFSEMREWLGKNAPPAAQLQSWKRALNPLLQKARWGRWLHLEHALRVASITGDLIFCALLLRSMAEDLQKLLVIDYPSTSEFIRAPDETAGFQEWFRLVSHEIEGIYNRDLSVLEKPTATGLHDLPTSQTTELRRIAQSLNDYVHPNFGSHVLALFPEKSQASDVLLEAATVIYSAFFSLEWSSREVFPGALTLSTPHVSDLPRCAWRIESRVLPSIRKYTRKNLPEGERIFHQFQTWLRAGYLTAAERDALVAAGTLDQLSWIVAQNRPQQSTAEILKAAESARLPVGIGRVQVLVLWARARKADKMIAQDSVELRSAAWIGSPEWLKYIASAIYLSISSSWLKLEMSLSQLAVQLANGNQLGAIFGARAILENYAAIEWLISRLEDSWDAIRMRADKGSLDSRSLEAIDISLAKYLTGSKGTVEGDRGWASPTAGDKNRLSMNIVTTVQRAFNDLPGLANIYEITSSMVHGRLMRGLELLYGADGNPYQVYNYFRAILVADHLCDDELQISLRARAAIMANRFSDLASTRRGDDSPETLTFAVLPIGKLKKGKHYTGSGTIDDPIRFDARIPYYEAVRKYCSDSTLDIKRRVSAHEGGRFVDIVGDGRTAVVFEPPFPRHGSDAPGDSAHEGHTGQADSGLAVGDGAADGGH